MSDWKFVKGMPMYAGPKNPNAAMNEGDMPSEGEDMNDLNGEMDTFAFMTRNDPDAGEVRDRRRRERRKFKKIGDSRRGEEYYFISRTSSGLTSRGFCKGPAGHEIDEFGVEVVTFWVAPGSDPESVDFFAALGLI